MGNHSTKQRDMLIVGFAKPEATTYPDSSTPSQTNPLEEQDYLTLADTGQFDLVMLPAQPRPFSVQLASHRLLHLSSKISVFSHHLHTLELQRNHLSTLPPEISQLLCLTWLDISHNNFKSLPTCIRHLSSLLELKADFNQITELPAELCEMDKLMTLSLAHNNISSLPDEVHRLDSLVTLNLNFNPIKILPCHIGRLKHLRYILLESCPLYTRATWNAEFNPQAAAASAAAAAAILSSSGQSSRDAVANAVAVAAAACYPPIRVLSLQELAARVIVRHNIPIHPPIPRDVEAYIKTAKVCSCCGGPFFSQPILRLRFIEKNGEIVPLLYMLCSEHWRTEAERIRSMFMLKPATSPRPLDRFEKERVLLRVSTELRISGYLPKSEPESFMDSSLPATVISSSLATLQQQYPRRTSMSRGRSAAPRRSSFSCSPAHTESTTTSSGGLISRSADTLGVVEEDVVNSGSSSSTTTTSNHDTSSSKITPTKMQSRLGSLKFRFSSGKNSF